MTPAIVREYNRLRHVGWRAAYALRAAKTNAEWCERSSLFDKLKAGRVRLRVEADDDPPGIDDDDVFNPKANPDIPLARLMRERQREIERREQDGMTGIVGEYFDGNEWVFVDSCWGFVGNDWRDSGYDVDIKRAALDAAKQFTNSQLMMGAV